MMKVLLFHHKLPECCHELDAAYMIVMEKYSSMPPFLMKVPYNA